MYASCPGLRLRPADAVRRVTPVPPQNSSIKFSGACVRVPLTCGHDNVFLLYLNTGDTKEGAIAGVSCGQFGTVRMKLHCQLRFWETAGYRDLWVRKTVSGRQRNWTTDADSFRIMYHTEPPTDKTIREWYMNSSRVAACALRNEQAVRAFVTVNTVMNFRVPWNEGIHWLAEKIWASEGLRIMQLSATRGGALADPAFGNVVTPADPAFGNVVTTVFTLHLFCYVTLCSKCWTHSSAAVTICTTCVTIKTQNSAPTGYFVTIFVPYNRQL